MYQKGNKELGIIALFSSGYNKQFYLREISRLSKIPLKTTQNAIVALEKKRILKSTVQGKNKYFKLNLDNVTTKFYLLQSEIYKTILFAEKYAVFKTFLKELKTNNALIVFGSFARFSADKNSDLDLLVIQPKKQDLPLHLLPYKIHKIELTEDSFIKSLEKQETLIKEIEENHILLNNHFFFINAMWGYYGK